MSKPSLVLIYYVFHKTYTKAKIKKMKQKLNKKPKYFLLMPKSLSCIFHGVSPHPATPALKH